jgi:NADH-quinone oxidoreductase subunit H
MSVAACAAWLAGWGLPPGVAEVLAWVLVVVAPMLLVIAPVAGLATMAERKVAAAMQRRVGPNYTDAQGPLELLFFWRPRADRQAAARRVMALPGLGWLLAKARRAGLAQALADGVKTIAKEDLVPAAADPVVFRAAPTVALAGSFLAFAVVPVSQHWVMADLSVGVVYVSGVTGLVVVAMIMAGWGSNNKWSLLGGMRAVAQILSYEIPVVLAMAAVVTWCGTMSLSGITAAQYHEGWASFLGWNLVQHPLLAGAALLFLIGSLAECNRTPFDLAEAESELVSGFNTEYSGMRWVFFAMAEYIDMLLAGALFAVLFLGGYQSPLGEAAIAALPPAAEIVVHGLLLAAKVAGVVALFIWLRWTLPRFRIDQVMWLAWSKLVPAGLVILGGTVVLAVVAGPRPGDVVWGVLSAPGLPAWGLAGQAVAWVTIAVPVALLWRAVQRRRASAEHPVLRRLAGRT